MTTLNDIEQLSFLGMRLALRKTIARDTLWTHAARCARRRNDNLRYWINNQELSRVKIVGLEYLRKAHEAGRGAVVTSFQVGPYNWIPLVLNKKADLPTTLLMDAANFQEEQRRWDARESSYTDTLIDPVKYINSEEPTAIWKMVCALRERRTLIGWFDGLTGTTASQSPQSAVSVDFCETQILVRMGLAFVSAKTGAPLILAVTHNDGIGGMVVRFEAPLTRHSSETIAGFCQRASQTFVSILESEVRADLPCWEEWCHFNLRNRFEPMLPSSSILDDEGFLEKNWRMNAENVEVLKMSEGEVLVSLRCGTALAMTPLMNSLCQALSQERRGTEIVSALKHMFSETELKLALRTLYESHFILPVVTSKNQDKSSREVSLKV